MYFLSEDCPIPSKSSRFGRKTLLQSAITGNRNSELALFLDKAPLNARNSVNFEDIFTFLGSKGPLARGEDIFISARLSNSIKIRPFW